MAMAAYTVIKTITFCYGHRILHHAGPCRHLHGHNARVDISLTTDRLDETGLVCDFREMKLTMKGWIDEHLDHRMILQDVDPAVPTLRAWGEPLYIMPAPPSAENLARLLYEQAHHLGLPVGEIRVWESDTACAIYRETPHGYD